MSSHVYYSSDKFSQHVCMYYMSREKDSNTFETFGFKAIKNSKELDYECHVEL